MRSSLRSVLLLLLPVGLLPSSATALESVERTLTVEQAVGRAGSVVVENLLGSVHLVAAPSPGAVRVEARVVAEAKSAEEAEALADSIRIERTTAGGEATFHVVFPLELHTAFRPPKAGMRGLIKRWTAPMFRDAASVDYDGQRVRIGPERKAAGLAVHLTVAVPYDLVTTVRERIGSVEGRALRGRLKISSIDGLVALERCLGTLEVETHRGEVRVAAFQGDELTLHSEHGSMELQDVRATRARLRTLTGSIRGDNVIGDELSVESGSGDVRFGGLEPKTVEVKTGSGQVDLATHLRTLRGAVIESATGDVTLRIGELTHFDLLAETKSGQVKTLGGLALEVVEQDGLTSRLQYGQGGPDVRVSALGGGLTVRPYDGSRLQLLVRD